MCFNLSSPLFLAFGLMKQIRAHAKYLGIPLMGDEVYGGTKNMALSLLQPKTPPMFHGKLSQLVSQKQRKKKHQNAEFGFHNAKNSWSISA